MKLRTCSIVCMTLLALFGAHLLAVAAPAPATDKNSVLIDKFVFSKDTGSSVANAANGGEPATLHNTNWVSPGYKGAKSAIHLDGKTSYVTLTQALTPSKAISIKAVIRPTGTGGMIFGDVGGLIFKVQDNAHLLSMRVSNGQWPSLESTDALPLGEWSEVECQWDGATMSLFINGKLSGQAPAGAGFNSGPRGLGCNIFNMGEFYAGDIASFELREMK